MRAFFAATIVDPADNFGRRSEAPTRGQHRVRTAALSQALADGGV